MQALDALAVEYETSEEMMKQMEHETAEGDMLFAVAYEAMDDLDKAQKAQALKATRESMDVVFRAFRNCWASVDGAFRELSFCRALRGAVCVDLDGANQRTDELKRKADDAHDRTRSHRERCRRAMKEHMKSEEALNYKLGCLTKSQPRPLTP